MKTLLYLLAFGLAHLSFADQWNLNDVSYLFPLPKANNLLIAAPDQGRFGPLIPQNVYQKMPSIIGGDHLRPKIYSTLRVLAVRIDPCFQDASHRCISPQIRFVWQPVFFDPKLQEWTTKDAAIHSFYRLTQREFKAVKQELWQLKLRAKKQGINTNGRPLGVHPAFESNHYQRPFHQDLVRVFLRYSGEKKLVQLTFMALKTANQWWRFGGIEKKGKNWRRMEIPRLGGIHTDLFNMDMTVDPQTGLGIGMNGLINIIPSSYPYRDNLRPVISEISRASAPQSVDLYRSKLEAINRFENPLKTNPNNLDCASCHFAEATRFFILDQFSHLKDHLVDRYQNPNTKVHSLRNDTITTLSTKIVRAFGYFGTEPAISNRVIHESALTAELFNR